MGFNILAQVNLEELPAGPAFSPLSVSRTVLPRQYIRQYFQDMGCKILAPSQTSRILIKSIPILKKIYLDEDRLRDKETQPQVPKGLDVWKWTTDQKNYIFYDIKFLLYKNCCLQCRAFKYLIIRVTSIPLPAQSESSCTSSLMCGSYIASIIIASRWHWQ